MDGFWAIAKLVMPAEVLDLPRGTRGEVDHIRGLGSDGCGLDSNRASASLRSRITCSPEMIWPAASSASLFKDFLPCGRGFVRDCVHRRFIDGRELAFQQYLESGCRLEGGWHGAAGEWL